MNLNDMIAWFETRGFKVTVTPIKTGHLFKISKYDYHAVSIYNDGFGGEVKQQYFLDHLLSSWNQGYHKYVALGKKLYEDFRGGYIVDVNYPHEKRVTNTWIGDMYPPTLFTNAITNETKGIFLSMVLDYTRIHGIQWECKETMGCYKMSFYLDRAHNPEQIIIIDWDKVENIGTLYNVVVRKLDAWRNEIEPLYITMPPRVGKTLYKHMLNSLYGKSPEYPTQLAIYAALMKGENNMTKEEITYIRQDVSVLANAFRNISRAFEGKLPGIKNVHFSGPCTVVIWEDKTKTVVRCKDGEVPDYEKGLAMAIAKKALGTNKSGSNYYDIFKKWLPKPEEPIVIDYATAAKEVPVEEEDPERVCLLDIPVDGSYVEILGHRITKDVGTFEKFMEYLYELETTKRKYDKLMSKPAEEVDASCQE